MGTRADVTWVQAALARYERPLIRYAVRITGDLESARDVVQDTFLRLCAANRAKVDNHLAAWLYTVCRNRALDVRKKEAHMEPLTAVEAETVESRAQAPSRAAANREAHALVLEALSSLPGQEQEAFQLKFQDELSYREIGQVMGVSLGTVSKLVAGALDAIRQQLRGKLDLTQEV